MDGEVKEGFICPICYSDLKTAVSLVLHFKEEHAGDENFLSQVKDIYGKAKKKIQGVNLSKTLGDSKSPEVPKRILGYEPSPVLSLENVSWRSHTKFFKPLRDMRNERYAAQTNTLLIRLEKLLQKLPSDPVRRKAYEQDIVPWLDEKNVLLCPGCAKHFNLLKRKHHCRLCGAVMCKSCTMYLPLERARKIISSSPGSQSKIGKELVVASPRTKLQPVQAVQAVQSVLSLDVIADGDFMLCEHCHRLLEAKEMIRQNRNDRPIIAQFYENLRSCLQACDTAVESYLKVNKSLREGESKYSLLEGEELRIEVLKLAESIDCISKKIAILGQNSESPPEGAHLKLQQTIRNAAAMYVKQNVIPIPSLPSEEEILEFQEIRRKDYEMKIEEERRKELEEEERTRLASKQMEEELGLNLSALNLSSTSRKKTHKLEELPDTKKVVMQDGWTPNVKQAIISNDPILEQIGILHGFIEQAKHAGKFDECEVLERNLRELEMVLDERESDNTQ